MNLPTSSPTTLTFTVVGEHAEVALRSFCSIQIADEADPETSVQFVTACQALARKFPQQTRTQFEAALPFSALERVLLARSPIEAAAVEALGVRLVEWATRSPILVEEATVHAADFLSLLTPHLDRWELREATEVAIGRLVFSSDG